MKVRSQGSKMRTPSSSVFLVSVWEIWMRHVTVLLPWLPYWSRPSSAPFGWTLMDCALIFPQGQGRRTQTATHTHTQTRTSRLFGEKGACREKGTGHHRDQTSGHNETDREMITWLMSIKRGHEVKGRGWPMLDLWGWYLFLGTYGII